jgi:hypothetical protein
VRICTFSAPLCTERSKINTPCTPIRNPANRRTSLVNLLRVRRTWQNFVLSFLTVVKRGKFWYHSINRRLLKKKNVHSRSLKIILGSRTKISTCDKSFFLPILYFCSFFPSPLLFLPPLSFSFFHDDKRTDERVNERTNGNSSLFTSCSSFVYHY